MNTIFLTDPRAIELRKWLVDNCRTAAQYGCNDRLLGLYLSEVEDDPDGLIEIKACDSVTGQIVTYQVTQ